MRKLKRFWRKHRTSLLYASIIAPVFIGMVLLDVWFRHPIAALTFWIVSLGWDICFAMANGKSRTSRDSHSHNRKMISHDTTTFVHYIITSDGAKSREERAS